MPLTPRLVPPRDDPQGLGASVSRVLDSLSPPTAFAPSLAATVSVAAGETKRLAPRAAGQNVVIPTADETNYGARIVLLVDGTLGACRVRAVSGTINGASAFTLSAGFVSSVELQSGGDGRWYAQRTNGAPISAGAGLSESGGVLAVNGSTSIEIVSDEVRRAALTGEVTAGANANATTVVRSTDYSTAPWTGNHNFEAQLRLGTEQTDAGTGAVNVTLGDVCRLRFTDASANITVGTISGGAEGRLLFLEFNGTGTHTLTHATSANGISCPNSVDLVMTGRCGAVLVSRDAGGGGFAWRVLGTAHV